MKQLVHWNMGVIQICLPGPQAPTSGFRTTTFHPLWGEHCALVSRKQFLIANRLQTPRYPSPHRTALAVFVIILPDRNEDISDTLCPLHTLLCPPPPSEFSQEPLTEKRSWGPGRQPGRACPLSRTPISSRQMTSHGRQTSWRAWTEVVLTGVRGHCPPLSIDTGIWKALASAPEPGSSLCCSNGSTALWSQDWGSWVSRVVSLRIPYLRKEGWGGEREREEGEHQRKRMEIGNCTQKPGFGTQNQMWQICVATAACLCLPVGKTAI